MNTEQFGAILFSTFVATSMFVGFVAFAGPPAHADTEESLTPGDVTGPGVIEQPGVYTLQNDIDLGGENVTAFEIKASDVVLDGNGHTIHNGTTEAIHVLASSSGGALSNVTVTNVTVTNVETAISTMNLEGGSFTDLRLVDNADAGLVFAGNDNANNVVDNSRFEDNEKGIFLREGTSGMTIQNSEFVTNHEVAIKASGSSGNEFLDSTFDGQDGEKTIHLTGESPDNVIRGNDIVHSAGPEYAIQVGGESARTVIEDNVVAHNTLGGISIGPPDAVVRNNEIYDNGDTGLLVESGGNTLEGNQLYENPYGVYLLGSGNDLAENVVKNNAEWDLYATEGATNNDVTALTIDDAGTEISVTTDAVDFALRGAAAPSPDAPEGYTAIDKYVEGATTSDSGLLDVQLHYTDGDVSDVTESELTVALFDDGTWTGVPGATVDEPNNYVSASTSAAGILGAVAGTGDLVDPVADAGDDQTVLVNETVTFDASASSDNEAIVSYEWDFGDGTNATGETVTHEYDTNGTYTVTLTVTDADGNTDTDTVTVTVLEADTTDPVADAGPDRYGLVADTFEFDGTASTDNVGIQSYEWDFGDGTNATGQTTSHSYTQAGTYTVTLTVTDTSGNTDTDTATVEVVAEDTEAPVADAGADRTVELGADVTFDGSDSTDNIGIDSYEWDFGDGTTATGETVTHAYSAEGDYTVTLTVTDAAGNTDSDQAVITVAEHVDEEVLTPGEISTAGVIEEEGVYVLTKDLNASEEGVTTAFEIKASNVTFVGNGHTVSGDVDDAAEGIHVLGSTGTLENVTIQDLTLVGWDSAISAKNVEDSAFTGVDYISNLDKGVALSGADSTNNRIAGSTFRDNEKGIFLERGADHTTVEDNLFDSNHEVGVKASGAPDATLVGNHFTGQDGEKTIHFTGESPRATIRDNVVKNSDGPEYAIQLGGESGDSVVENNTVVDNTLGGISAGPLNVDIRNNHVADNGDIAILVGDGGGTVEGNEVTQNRVGLAFDGSTGVTAADNVVKNNLDADVMALDGATNNVVTGLEIDDAGTVIAIDGASTDYTVEGGVAEPDALPGDYTLAGEYLDVDLTSDDGRLDFTVDSSTEINGDTEDDFTVVRYDADKHWWVGLPTTVDTGSDSLSTTVEEPGVVAPVQGTTDIEPPTANATANESIVAVNETVAFDASASTDNVGVVTYEWDFGDGTNATGETVTHEFADNGNYAVTLTVYDDAGYYDTATVDVGVDGEDPVADAGDDAIVQPNDQLDFDGSASTDDVGIDSYEWDFGDGTNATGETVTHAYGADGEYTVNLTVTDYLGNNDTDSLGVTVDSEAPVPDAGPDSRSVSVDEVLSFDASASTDNVGIDSYEWNFGDGTTATGVTTSHAYDAAGTYTVTLTVVDSAGNEAATTVDVTVEADSTDDGGTSPPADDDGDSDDSTAGGGSVSAPVGGTIGGGAGGGADSGGTDPGQSAGPNVNVTHQNGTQAQVSVQNAGEGDRIRATFQFQEGEACIDLEELAFRSRTNQSFQLRVGQSTDAPGNATAWQARTGEPAFGYINVDHDAQVDDGQFTFQVRTDCLGDADTNPEHLRLYRYQDGDWVRQETRLLQRNETHVRYEADAPGFSTFAVGYAEADISVTDASIGPTTIATGEATTLSVTLQNQGEVEGSDVVEMVSDGVALESTEVTVQAGDTETVSLTHQFDEAGEYTITVDGVTAGTVVVESPEGTEPPAEETPAADPGADDGGEDGGSTALLGFVMLGLLALAAVYVLYARRGASK